MKSFFNDTVPEEVTIFLNFEYYRQNAQKQWRGSFIFWNVSRKCKCM